ncbi:MAG: hypothetical protein HWE27_08655 [Gammaproteobacteria bacterium]|nr:hypothetical protein [Gammaproteobacteria bacterium]
MMIDNPNITQIKPLHFAGHIISSDDSGRFPISMESTITNRVSEWIELHEPLHGFGSLASGADLIIAEEFIRKEFLITPILPFPISFFKSTSIKSSGNNWEARFDKVIAAYPNPLLIFDSFPVNQNLAYSMVTLVALGLAKFYSQSIQTHPLQLTIWDGEVARPDAGTYADQMKAKALEFECSYIDSHTGGCHQQNSSFPDIKKSIASVTSNLIIFDGFTCIEFNHFVSLIQQNSLTKGAYDFLEKESSNERLNDYPITKSKLLFSTRLFALLQSLAPEVKLQCKDFKWSRILKWVELCL